MSNLPTSFNNVTKRELASVDSAHIKSILSKAKFKGLDCKSAEEHFATCLSELNGAQETKTILEALRFSSYVNIVFDFESDDLKSLGSSNALGWYNDSEKELLVGAKDISLNKSRFLGVFAHELAHWCMQLVFKNHGNPYYQSDPKRLKAREFEEIVEAVRRDFQNNPNALHPVIRNCFDSYPQTEWNRELIVRVPHLVAGCGSAKTEEILSRQESTKLLLEFYRSHVIDEIDTFIAEGDLEGARETIYRLNNKFGLLQRYVEHELEFCRDEDVDLHEFSGMTVYSSRHPFLTFLKIARTLNCIEPNTKFSVNNIFCSFHVFAGNHLKIRKIFSKFEWCKTLFVLCTGVKKGHLSDYEDWLEDLNELAAIPGKRVILFIGSEFLIPTKTRLVNSKFVDLSSRKLDIRDLVESSQQRILRYHVTFLGKPVQLQDLISSDEPELVDGDLIERLLNGEQVTVGSGAVCFENRLPGFVTFYENLSVRRLMDFVDECKSTGDVVIIVGGSENYPEQVKRKLCKLFEVDCIEALFVSPADQFPTIMEDRRVLLVSSRSDYECSHIVDLLKNHSSLVCYVINIESEETIYADLLYAPSLKFDRKLLQKNHQGGDDFDENEFIRKLFLHGYHRIFVISDKAGSGKSHFLNNIQFILDTTGHQIMKFALRECTSFIDKHTIEPGLKLEDAVRFLCTFGQIDNFGRKLLSSNMKNRPKSPVILLLDGFDEIGSSYSNDSVHNKMKIANLIMCLEKYSSMYVLVTTRSESEMYFNNPARPVFTFKPLKPSDTDNYINLYCEKRVRLQKMSPLRSPSIPHPFKTAAFTNSPLHITMISEMFLEMTKNDILKSPVQGTTGWNPSEVAVPSLERLYSEFIDMKYRIYFKEKKDSAVDNRTKENCDSAFQKLALFSIYGNEEFAKGCFSKDSMFQRDSDGSVVLNADKIREYYDVGMFTSFSRSSVEFIHREFAEYFVAKLFSSMLHDEQLSAIPIFAVVSKLPKDYRAFMKYRKSDAFDDTYPIDGSLYKFVNLMIRSAPFSEETLEAHQSAMESLGAKDTVHALSVQITFSYHNIFRHIIKCWTNVGKFHDLLYAASCEIPDFLPPEPRPQEILNTIYSKSGIPNFWAANWERLFIQCMKAFCYTHRHGAPLLSNIMFEILGIQCHCLYLLESGNIEVLDALIQVMVDNKIISSENKVGKLMHLAVYSGNKTVVKWMEEMGGDIFSKTDDGISTVAYAIHMGKYEMAEWLQQRGVKIRDSTENRESTVKNEACVSVYVSEQLICQLYDLGVLKNLLIMFEYVDFRRVVMEDLRGHEETLELLRTFAEVGSDVLVCSVGGMNALHCAAVAGNDPDILDRLKHQGMVHNDQSNDGKSAFHVSLEIDFLLKPVPGSLDHSVSSPCAPDSEDEGLVSNCVSQDFICDNPDCNLFMDNEKWFKWGTKVLLGSDSRKIVFQQTNEFSQIISAT